METCDLRVSVLHMDTSQLCFSHVVPPRDVALGPPRVDPPHAGRLDPTDRLAAAKVQFFVFFNFVSNLSKCG
jgi:hypothetical protein